MRALAVRRAKNVGVVPAMHAISATATDRNDAGGRGRHQDGEHRGGMLPFAMMPGLSGPVAALVAKRELAARVGAQPSRVMALVGYRAQSHVPWNRYAALRGMVRESTGGVRTRLLAVPVDAPPGWEPKVHRVTDKRELERRAVEAKRLVPAMGWASWEKLLGEPRARILDMEMLDVGVGFSL